MTSRTHRFNQQRRAVQDEPAQAASQQEGQRPPKAPPQGVRVPASIQQRTDLSREPVRQEVIRETQRLHCHYKKQHKEDTGQHLHHLRTINDENKVT
eukprot:168268-Amphidinium_carterae.2